MRLIDVVFLLILLVKHWLRLLTVASIGVSRGSDGSWIVEMPILTRFVGRESCSTRDDVSTGVNNV